MTDVQRPDSEWKEMALASATRLGENSTRIRELEAEGERLSKYRYACSEAMDIVGLKEDMTLLAPAVKKALAALRSAQEENERLKLMHHPGCPAIADDESDYEHLADAGICACTCDFWAESNRMTAALRFAQKDHEKIEERLADVNDQRDVMQQHALAAQEENERLKRLLEGYRGEMAAAVDNKRTDSDFARTRAALRSVQEELEAARYVVSAARDGWPTNEAIISYDAVVAAREAEEKK